MNKRSRILLTILAVLVAILAGMVVYGVARQNNAFGTGEPSSGTVITKTFAPSYQEERERCAVFTQYGCVDYETYEVTEPARWEVVYQDEDGNIGYDDVSPVEYADIEVGDYYERD